MKNIWIFIKAVLIVIMGIALFAIMATSTFVYGLYSGLKKMKVTKNKANE